jgi:protein-disulfide isomerase
MATRQQERARRRAERLRLETEAAADARGRRRVQYGSAAVLIALVLTAVLIAVSQSGGGGSPAPASPGRVADARLVGRQLAGIPQHGNVLGRPNAKVKIVEFGDLQCPVCQEFSFVVAPRLIAGVVRHGKAAYEFRPWDVIGPQSPAASSAALAAGQQNRFWNFAELFYRNQQEENSGYATGAFLTKIARAAGIPDLARWQMERAPSKWGAELAGNAATARRMGFPGTPSILVQGPRGQRALLNVPTKGEITAAISSVE